MSTSPIHFLKVVSKDAALETFFGHLMPAPLEGEPVPLAEALGRVLAEDVIAPLDIPPFDRSKVDGFAVVAQDTYGAEEETPREVKVGLERIPAGHEPRSEVRPGLGLEIATGGVVPRGANAVVMVEHVEPMGDRLRIHRPVAPGENIQALGSDMRAGELIYRAGDPISSRETGVLAALGISAASCVRRPRVAVISTGDELVPPGEPLRPGRIYDSNARILCDAVRENGGEATYLGIAPDSLAGLEAMLQAARRFDVVLLSGGTSKGAGDLTFQRVQEIEPPGVLVHGVAIRPGKPVVLAAWGRTPVVVLPGFPTSAIVTFHLFVRPLLRILAGLPPLPPAATVSASLPLRLHSAAGRHEYVLVNLVRRGDGGWAAYPIPKPSGSMTAFSMADGYLEVAPLESQVPEGSQVSITMLSSDLRPPDLTFIGSHCLGVDAAMRLLRPKGIRARVLHVGSLGGIQAAKREEADLAGLHLRDESGVYNEPFVRDLPGLVLFRGYHRRQGILTRQGEMPGGEDPLAALLDDPARRIINRPLSAGTRVLLEQRIRAIAAARGVDPRALKGAIPGFEVEAGSHSGVAAAIAAGRADWGVAIQESATRYGLEFHALADEEYDFLIPRSKLGLPAIAAFLEVLRSRAFREALEGMVGFAAPEGMGEPRWMSPG